MDGEVCELVNLHYVTSAKAGLEDQLNVATVFCYQRTHVKAPESKSQRHSCA